MSEGSLYSGLNGQRDHVRDHKPGNSSDAGWFDPADNLSIDYSSALPPQSSQYLAQSLFNTPSVPTTDESTNWSGAVLFAGSGESFSTVSAQWVVPTVTQVPLSGVTTTDIAEWVGIDGYNSSDVAQAGVMEIVQTANGQTTITTEAWDEWYPADSNTISASAFDVNPGNTISVTVETSGAGATRATFILDDETTGQTYETSLSAPHGTSLVGNSAEAVVETPEWISGNQVSQPLLTDFLTTPVVFKDVGATYSNGSAASLSSAQSIGMVTTDVPGSSGYVQEAYGSIQPSNDLVTVTEDDYWGPNNSITVAGTSSDALQGGAAVALLASAPVISDSNVTNLASVTVQITNGSGSPVSGDELFVNGQQSGTLDGGLVSVSWSSSTDSLKLTGNVSIAEYQTLLSEVTYRDTGTDMTTSGHPVRTVTWTVNDGTSTDSTTSSVTIDRAPVANNVFATDSTAATVTATGANGVLSHDIDLDGDTLTVTGVSSGSQAGAVGQTLAGVFGTLTLNANGSYSYVASNTAALNTVTTGVTPSDTFTYTISDGNGGTASASLIFVIDRPPMVTAANITLSSETVAASSLFTASDPDGSAIISYQFTDSGPGEFLLNGVAQPHNQDITVSAAQLSQLTYQGGTSGPTADTVEVRAYDGTLWSNWTTFTVAPPAVTIRTDTNTHGTTSLQELGSNYYIDFVTGGVELTLKYGGSAVVQGAGSMSGWNPIGAAATASGYEVAWKDGSANLYTVWNTDSNGNYISDTIGNVAGNNAALEALEPSFQQDLNSDGFIGVVATIEAYGATSLQEFDGNYYLDPVAGGVGPTLDYGGAAVVAGVGAMSGWNSIGAEATASGYEIAWQDGSQDLYTVWNADSNGNYVYDTMGDVSGNSLALEELEASFHQDLNGDGTIGIPGGTIESFGVTALVQQGDDFFLNPVAGGTGPEVTMNGVPIGDSQVGGWTAIGAEATASGYEIAWHLPNTDLYTVWNLDSSGNFVSDTVGALAGNSATLEALETSFHQDLNGDGFIGAVTTIQTDGPTSLQEADSSYYLDLVSGGVGPTLKYDGDAVVAGVGAMNGWNPIGAAATSSGYEVAWQDGSQDLYTVWNTDSNGNYVYDTMGNVSGNSLALESLEPSFQQDLNGDGTIGIPGGTIESFGVTALVQQGDDFFLDPVAGGTGPEVTMNGAPIGASQVGGWTAIGAEAMAGGYEMAWHLANTDLYTVWNLDSSGNFVSDTVGALAGNSATLENLETSFHQDLNGDGMIGIPGGTTIESFGVTALVQQGDDFFLNPVAGGTGPEVTMNGVPIGASQVGGWQAIGAEATAGGYEMAWQLPNTALYTVWNLDSSGNFVSDTVGALAGNSATLESLEPSFQQDLNGDGVIGIPTTNGGASEIQGGANEIQSAAVIGVPENQHSS